MTKQADEREKIKRELIHMAIYCYDYSDTLSCEKFDFIKNMHKKILKDYQQPTIKQEIKLRAIYKNLCGGVKYNLFDMIVKLKVDEFLEKREELV